LGDVGKSFGTSVASMYFTVTGPLQQNFAGSYLILDTQIFYTAEKESLAS
jgi:hypothetical protein